MYTDCNVTDPPIINISVHNVFVTCLGATITGGHS